MRSYVEIIQLGDDGGWAYRSICGQREKGLDVSRRIRGTFGNPKPWVWIWGGGTWCPTPSLAEPGLSTRRAYGKGAAVYTDDARDPGSLPALAGLGLAGSKGISPELLGKGNSRKGGSVSGGLSEPRSGASWPAEGAKSNGVRSWVAARGPRLEVAGRWV